GMIATNTNGSDAAVKRSDFVKAPQEARGPAAAADRLLVSTAPRRRARGAVKWASRGTPRRMAARRRRWTAENGDRRILCGDSNAALQKRCPQSAAPLQKRCPQSAATRKAPQ